jgi:hypothetical protein
MYLLPQVIDYLVTLGFPSDALRHEGTDEVYHPEHPGVYVAHRRRNLDRNQFRFSFNPNVRTEKPDTHRVYVNPPDIADCVLDGNAPRWRRKAIHWFQGVIFDTKSSRERAEALICRYQRQQAAAAALMGPELAEHAKDVIGCFSFSSAEDGTITAASLNWSTLRPTFVTTPGDPASRLRALGALYSTAKAHGMDLL